MTNAVPVKIKLFDDNTALPEYKSAQAAGFDLSNRVEVIIPAHEVKMVGTGIALEIPENYWVLIAARSSLHKMGLMLANGIGVGDPDFCGDEDEYQILLYNRSDKDVTVAAGTRLAQAILLPRTVAKFTKVAQLDNKNRGGIGSTGTR